MTAGAEVCEKHGEIRAACLDCLQGAPPERRSTPPARPQPASRPFAARFAGDCPGCGLGIHQGQLIVRMDDDRHYHDTCTEDA